jgi:glutathione S-transferase
MAMTITIYGSPGSRARRPLWVARELRLDVENIVPAAGETKQPAFLGINPNGKVPALIEGDFKLFESFALSLYLAKKFGLRTLYPEDPQEEALVWQWTFWGLNELEKPLVSCLFDRVIKAEAERDEAAAEKAEQSLQAPLGVLDRSLEGRDWLLGNQFTVADINLAAVVALAKGARVSLSAFRNVENWRDRALSRPAYAG